MLRDISKISRDGRNMALVVLVPLILLSIFAFHEGGEAIIGLVILGPVLGIIFLIGLVAWIVGKILMKRNKGVKND